MEIVEIGEDEEATANQELVTALPEIRVIAAKVAYKYGPRAAGMIEDLAQAGVVGFMEASRRYRPVGGMSRSEYALSMARYAIYGGLRHSKPNKRAARAKAREVNRIAEYLTVMFGRKPGSIEMADMLDIPIDRYYRMLEELTTAGLVDRTLFRGGSEKAVDPLVDPNRHGLFGVEVNRLRAAISGLPEKEREVVHLAFFSSMTLEDIGAKLGYTKGYISKLRKRGLRHLEKLMADGAIPAERRSRIDTSHSCRPSLGRSHTVRLVVVGQER